MRLDVAYRLVVLFCAVALSCCACSGDTAGDRGRVRVAVSILPEAYFVERVGGAHVDVDALVKSGQSEHSYEPTPRQVAWLSEAKVYFAIGVPFEKALLTKIRETQKGLEIVDLQAGLKLRMMKPAEVLGEAAHGAGGHGGEHGQEPDPHTWLDPKLAKRQGARFAMR